jgi:zeta-carotene desaturase
MTHSISPDVVVIGAGVAGLRAAVALAARGARVCVLESKAVLGGRATSFNDPQTGERVDNGQHVLLGCYEDTFDFLRQIGTLERVQLQPNLDVEFIDRLGNRSRLRLPPLPPPMNLIAGLFDWEALGWTDRLAALRLSGPIRIARAAQEAESRGEKPARIAASPGETVEQWLVANGQTVRVREMLWEPLAHAALNQSIREAAAPPFATVLGRMFGGAARDAALALPLCPLDELYAEPARRFIEARGGQIRIGAPARVHLTGGRVAFVESRGERIQTSAVVAAVAWHSYPELFAGDVSSVEKLCAAAAGTQPSPIVSVNLWLDRRVLNTPFLGLPGRSMQWVFDKEQMFDSPSSHLALVSSGAARAAGVSNEDLIAAALNELRDALPETRTAKVRRAAVIRERSATFSLAPGQPPRPGTRTNVERLVLAGDWIETGLPATIEGAAISGRRAADALS